MRNRKPDIERKIQNQRHQWLHRCASLFLCFAFCLYWIAVSEAKIIERILAIVNDDIITQTELDERLVKEKEMLKVFYQYDEERLAQEMEKNRPEALGRMINELLFIQEAVKKGMRVTDAEVQQFISTLKKQYGSTEEFQKALAAEGYTEYTFMKERKRAVLRDKLIKQEFGSELEVTDEEVRQFYKGNRDKFPGKEDTVKLKRIFIKFQTTEADKQDAFLRASDLLKRCKDGADFGEMAEAFSDHEPTKSSGGDMGYFYPGMGQHDPMLEKTASKLAIGEISDLMETPAGYDFIKVTDLKENAIRAQRISITIRPTLESEKAAEEKINSVAAELQNGADFVALAEQYSDDPLVKENSGDWKEISIDLMTPELRKSFNSFDLDEISQPVKTPLGIHIFKITEVRDLTEDEMERVRRFLSDTRLDEKLEEYSKKLREKAYIQMLAEN